MESTQPHLTLPQRGFSLVEMIVVLAIIITITTIALVGQTSFNRSLLLTDTAYTVALSIRQAQSLGQSSRAFSGIANAGYGVHFSSATPTRYEVFADISPAAPGDTVGGRCGGHSVTTGPESRPGNCQYDSSTELMQQYTFGRGFYVSDMCGVISGTRNCLSSTGLNDVNIVFQRPDTASRLLITVGSSRHEATCVEIKLSTQTGDATRTIRVSQLGEVSVNQTCQ
jgi:prepilin-type N-terminal cleavage/methylation domain-containing protein